MTDDNKQIMGEIWYSIYLQDFRYENYSWDNQVI